MTMIVPPRLRVTARRTRFATNDKNARKVEQSLAEGKWAVGLIRTRSGVKLNLYVKCRGGEEACEKRVAYLLVISFCNPAFIVLGTKSLMQRELWREQNL